MPFTVVLVGFVIMTALYIAGPGPVYFGILEAWGVKPFRFVFLDTDTVLSAVRCLRQGIDVFVVNPCDVLGRVFDYSPLWLLLAKLPVTPAWLMPAGLAIDMGFFLSLLLLPAGANWRDSMLISLGAISTAVVFAVERGNNDLVLFALAAVAATLACKSAALRLVGYSAAFLAGLLKYYPMTMLALATREKPGRFWGVVALVLAGLALFLAEMGHDLMRAVELIPTGNWFGDMFGSSTFAGGLTQLLGWSATTSAVIHFAMALGALSIGLWMAIRPNFMRAIVELDDRERTFLLVGSCLIISCFFTAQNIGYRATHLLLALPAALALARACAQSALIAYSPMLIILLLWAEGWRNALLSISTAANENAIFLMSWIARECLWWTVVTLLIACTASILGQSEMAQRIFPKFSRRFSA